MKINARQLINLKEAYGILTTSKGGKIKSNITKVDTENNFINLSIEFDIRGKHTLVDGRILIEDKTVSWVYPHTFPLLVYRGDKISLDFPIEVICN